MNTLVSRAFLPIAVIVIFFWSPKGEISLQEALVQYLQTATDLVEIVDELLK